MNLPSVYTVPEAAAAVGIDEQRLRAAIRRGDVAAEQHGGRWLLTRRAVEELLGEPIPEQISTEDPTT